MSFLELQNVDKIYNYKKKNTAPVYALNKINVSIKEGEMVAILGKSGAGKSTLMHILGCLDMPTFGDYILQGDNIKNKSDKELAIIRNEKFGFILQDFGVIEHLTVNENISIPLAFSKKKIKNNKQLCQEVLRKIDMDKHANKQVSLLSGGERQRVSIARALINNPDVIFADEPTGSLDTENGKNILDIFSKLNNEGKTIVIVTHDPSVAEYCSRKIVISDGKII